MRFLQEGVGGQRTHPAGSNWIWVTTYAEAIVLLELDEVEELSFGHVLALTDPVSPERTGYGAAVDRGAGRDGRITPPKLKVHLVKPPAHKRMQRAIDSIDGRAGRSSAD